MNEEYTKLCRISELQEKEGKRFFVNNREVALFKVDGKVYALDNICPHKQSALIYDGFVEDGTVSCPAHGWKFNLDDGKMANKVTGVEKFDVKIEDEEVFVRVTDKKLNW